jgi:uncharacterized Zn-finger protein
MLRRVTTLLRPVATKRTTKTTSLFSVRSSRAKTASNLTQTRTFLGLFNNNKKIEHEEPGQKTAMELISEVPPIEVEGRVAACDGGGGPLGHPRVFINLDPTTPEQAVPCGYCGLRFIQKGYYRGLKAKKDEVLTRKTDEEL